MGNSDKALNTTSTTEALGQPTVQIGETSQEATTSTTEASDDDGYVSDDTNGDSDVMFVGITVPPEPVATIMGKVYHSRSYKCYLCGFSSELQLTFIKDFTTKHQFII